MQLEVDLTNCEKEPIHILGHIQSHGYLVAISPEEYTIVHVSDNIPGLVNRSAAELLGQSIENLLVNTDLPSSNLTELLNVGKRADSWESINPYRFRLQQKDYNLIIHKYDDLIILEWEPVGADSNTFLNQKLIAESLTDVQSSRTLTELWQHTANRVKSIIGFDRVMVYRFGSDWHGEVVAEAKEDHLEPFLGLHYPASDIPRQARELYKTNLVRLIVDVDSTPSAILSSPNRTDARPLDMTHSGLRAVSPVHIQYLKNMGVKASMSISLIYRGELWGLISCHNHTARFVDYSSRQAAKFVSQLLSAALEFRKDADDQTALKQLQQNEQTIYSQILADWDVSSGLVQHPLTALDVVHATGAVVLFDDKIQRIGQTPDEEAIKSLSEWLKMSGAETFFETSQLPNIYPPAADFREIGSGMLAIVLSRELNEYLIWFKPERIQEVTWAGNPEKPVTVTEGGQTRLGPRTSFAAWTETVRNTSNAWSEAEISTAIKLREDILQVINRKANEVRVLNERLRVAYEELDAFSYTVSHDLRTPLSSIRCYSEIILEEYGHEFNDDARALFDKIIFSTDRMRALIRHILYYSRMGRTDPDIQLVNMKSLLETVREDVLVNEKNHNRNLTIDIKSTPSLYADQTMVLQLFSNLLSNSAKYTRPVTKAVITVEGRQEGDEVIYTVHDNGIGFDMKQAGKMFELFKRLENAKGFEGSGVGLAIVKRIINRHKGKLWFHSEPNRETIFSVSFPVPPNE